MKKQLKKNTQKIRLIKSIKKEMYKKLNWWNHEQSDTIQCKRLRSKSGARFCPIKLFLGRSDRFERLPWGVRPGRGPRGGTEARGHPQRLAYPSPRKLSTNNFVRAGPRTTARTPARQFPGGDGFPRGRNKLRSAPERLQNCGPNIHSYNNRSIQWFQAPCPARWIKPTCSGPGCALVV